MLRLLALESVRHNAVVVGEDLGTMPPDFRDMLRETGVHGMRVLWFERDAAGGFVPPDHWDPSAAAMTTTHDLPTVAGWWRGTDIAARVAVDRLGPGVTEASALAERETDRASLWRRLVESGITGDPPPSDDTPGPVVDAALRFVARTPSPLSLIPLEDVLGQAEQPNLPGTVEGHPNWQRRAPGPAGELLDGEATARRVAVLAGERPRR